MGSMGLKLKVLHFIDLLGKRVSSVVQSTNCKRTMRSGTDVIDHEVTAQH